MSEYSSLKATINANVKTNGNQEITGSIMNSVLNAMVDSLGRGFQFMGIATLSYDPGEPDEKVFYVAYTPGQYEHFGGLSVLNNEVAIFAWNGSWIKAGIPIASLDQINSVKLYSRANNVEFMSRVRDPYSITGKVVTFKAECYLIAFNSNNGYLRINTGTTIDFSSLPTNGFMAAYVVVNNLFWEQGVVPIGTNDIRYITFGDRNQLPENSIVLATCTDAGIQLPVLNSISYNSLTQAGANYKLIACVIRCVDGVWQQIGNAHKSLNVASVSQDGNRIIINYSFTAKNVVSLVVTPDEDFASIGYELGNSVGLSYTNIYIFNKRPIFGTIYYYGGEWHSSNPEIQVSSFDGGILTLTHPTAENSFAVVTGDGRGQYVYGAVSANQTTTMVYVRDFNGALVENPSNTMQFSFERRRDSINVPAADANQSGNIWVFGIMEV